MCNINFIDNKIKLICLNCYAKNKKYICNEDKEIVGKLRLLEDFLFPFSSDYLT